MCTWLNSIKELTRQVNILLLESKLHKDAYVLVVSQNKHHIIRYFPDCVARIQKETLPCGLPLDRAEESGHTQQSNSNKSNL